MASVGAVSGNDVRVLLSMNALPPFRSRAPLVAPAEVDMGTTLASKNMPPVKQRLDRAAQLGKA